MESNYDFDCAIIGGGLAGLCLAIQLRQLNHSVVIFEKNEYPFHKVCGEYISMESWDFIASLGVPLSQMNLPIINQLGVSSEKGYMLEAPLSLGGFGISRYTLDHALSEIAISLGVKVFTNCKVFDTSNDKNGNELKTSKGVFSSKIVCGSYGRFTPSFIAKSIPESTNYIGVKYHIKSKMDANRIELHNFKDGYCGISKIEDDKFCLCYLTTAKNLQDSDNDIKKMEEKILKKNPFMRKFYEESEFLFEKPITISKVTFKKKSTFKHGAILLGDAAGSIAPLCGNGMSMAMRASKLLAFLLDDYFNGRKSFEILNQQYQHLWNINFATRISAGYHLQKVFGKNIPTHLSLLLLNKLPKITQKLISLTHGKPY